MGRTPHEVERTPLLSVFPQQGGKRDFSGESLQIMRTFRLLQGCTLGSCGREAFSERTDLRGVVARPMASLSTMPGEARYNRFKSFTRNNQDIGSVQTWHVPGSAVGYRS